MGGIFIRFIRLMRSLIIHYMLGSLVIRIIPFMRGYQFADSPEFPITQLPFVEIYEPNE